MGLLSLANSPTGSNQTGEVKQVNEVTKGLSLVWQPFSIYNKA